MNPAVLALYRVRGAIFFAATAVLVAVALFGRFLEGEVADAILLGLVVAGLAGWLLCLLLAMFGAKAIPQRQRVTVHSPVSGRWLAMNSPASQTPSHGTRAYGQAHAVDLVFEPEGYARPAFGTWPAMREPQEFKAFGQPVVSMVDGVVVRASDWRRDHRSRTNLIAFAYLMAEGAVRELGGPGFVVGNHVVVRDANGDFAATVHLSQGSKTVNVGDTVRAGDIVGACGNSGNSSEPHVHAQLMDRASFWTAQGVPFAFSEISIDGQDPADGMPRNGQHLTAGEPEPRAE